MTLTCKNCNQHFKGNFCHNCGQAASTHPINFHFLWHDVQHGLLHLDKGAGFTIRQLFTRPGHSIREFIEGKRVHHYKPISLVLVFAGVFGLLLHYFHINRLAESVTIIGTGEDASRVKFLMTQANDWISAHYALVSLLQLPFYALGTWIAFRKTGYNFIEHIVINAFLTGQRLVIRIALFPLFYLLNESTAMNKFNGLLNFLNFALTYWTFKQLFNTLSGWSVFWRSVVSFAIAIILFIVVVAFGVLVMKTQGLTPS